MLKIMLVLFFAAAALLAQPSGLYVGLSGTAPTTPTAPGASITIPLQITSTAGYEPAGVQFTLTDSASALSGISVAIGPAGTAAGKTAYCATGTVATNTICLIVGMNTTTIANGVLANISGTIKPTVSASSVTLTLGGLIAASPTGTSLSIGAPTPIVIPVLSPCDLNADGKIDMQDLSAIAQQAQGAQTCKSGDLDGNGKCDLWDAMRVILAAFGGGCKVGP